MQNTKHMLANSFFTKVAVRYFDSKWPLLQVELRDFAYIQ